MTERCCDSMQHYEHMCSLTLNGCAIERVAQPEAFVCSPCQEKGHNHRFVCTSSYVAT